MRQSTSSTSSKACHHLSTKQQQELQQVLQRYPSLFTNKLRKYPEQIHFYIDDTVAPSFQRHYPIPHHNLAAFKRRYENMVEQDVLEPAEPAQWCAPTFGVPKQNGTIRIVTDFRRLNVAVKRRPYPLPIIPDLLRKYSGYKYFTKLDMTMMFYTFELDDESRQYCTISTPFGLYRYKRLPMGIKVAPDLSQERMEHTLRRRRGS